MLKIIGSIFMLLLIACAVYIGLYALRELIDNLIDYIKEKREKKVKDMWNTFTDDQKTYIEYLIGQALNKKEDE